jgi:pilus assembly protein CpaE
MDSEHRGMIKKQLVNLPYAIVGEANYGVEASRLAMELHPDIVLVHVEEPLALAFRTLDVIQQADPATVPVVISKLGDAETARKAMLAGARGYIVSPCTPTTLNDVLQTAHARRPSTGAAQSPQAAIAPAAGSIITVFGPKGGIGKTTLSTNLAIALRKHTSTRVALVDLDAYFGDVAVIMGMEPSASLLDLAEAAPLDEFPDLEPYLTEHRSGVQVLAARHPGDVGAPPDPELMARGF